MGHLLLILAFALVASARLTSAEISIGTPTVENRAEDFIEQTLADEFGLGDLSACCRKPSSKKMVRPFRRRMWSWQRIFPVW